MDVNVALFIAGLVVFFGTHLFTAFRSRDPEGRVLGLPAGPYKGLYSILSLGSFVAMIWGYAYLKPWIPIWDPPVWTRHVALSVMPFAVILLVSSYVPTGYIKKAVGHPMLVAVILWSAAHLLANGDLAAILLFGSFFVFAIIDRIAVRARGDRGPIDKHANVLGDMIAIAVGGAVYGLIVAYLHPILFGAEIMPYEMFRP
jgi:uncharacterized membrane protein